MGKVVVKTEVPRVWKSLSDAEFKNKPEALEQFKGTLYAECGPKTVENFNNNKCVHPCFSQKWPYNSYVSDAVIKQQLKNDLLYWVGLFYDIKKGHWVEVATDVFFPVIGNLLGSFFGRRRRKSKKGDDEHHNLEPAGCGHVALLTLLWLFRDYTCVKNNYSGIEKIKAVYDTSDNKDDNLEKVMKKIFNNNLTLKNIDYGGTSSIIKFSSIPLTMYKSVTDNHTREHEATVIFEAVALNKVPVVVALKGDTLNLKGHYAVIQGIEFDYENYIKTGKFKDSMKLYINMGREKGPLNYYEIDAYGKPSSFYTVNDINKYEIRNLHVLAPNTKITYNLVTANTIATDEEKVFAIAKRKQFDELVGKNYEAVPSETCKYKKGEVVYAPNILDLLISDLAVVVSDRTYEDGLYYYKISYITESTKKSYDETLEKTNSGAILARQLLSIKVNNLYVVPEDNLKKVFSKDLDAIFLNVNDGLKASKFFFVNKFAVGQHIYNDPHLMSQDAWFIRISDAYISKIYNDGSCDVYFPYSKKTYHSTICFGDDYVEKVPNIPYNAPVPALFSNGESVYFDDNGTIYKTSISSTSVFVSGLQRVYLVKNPSGTTIQVGESSLYKIVGTFRSSDYQ